MKIFFHQFAEYLAVNVIRISRLVCIIEGLAGQIQWGLAGSQPTLAPLF